MKKLYTQEQLDRSVDIRTKEFIRILYKMGLTNNIRAVSLAFVKASLYFKQRYLKKKPQ